MCANGFCPSTNPINFAVPMYPTKWLTFGTVSGYMKEQERKGSGTAAILATESASVIHLDET